MKTQPPRDIEELTERLRDPSTCREAFGEVIDAFTQPLYWQIRRMVGSHDDTNDLLQNTFMKAWMSLENFRGDAKLSTWLYKIAINESLTFLQREQRRAVVPLESTPDSSEESAGHSPADTLEADPYFDGDRLQARLLDAVATLPDKQRLVFNMRYFDEMEYKQMSEVLGTSVGALKASYHLAVKKIEQYFNSLD